MIKTENNIVITYKELKEESIVRLNIRDIFDYEVIAVPRQISVTCGIAQRINRNNFEKIRKIINNLIVDKNIPIEHINFYEEYFENNDVKYKKIP